MAVPRPPEPPDSYLAFSMFVIGCVLNVAVAQSGLRAAQLVSKLWTRVMGISCIECFRAHISMRI